MVTLIIFKFSVPIPRTNCFKLVSIKKIDKLLQRQKKTHLWLQYESYKIDNKDYKILPTKN